MLLICVTYSMVQKIFSEADSRSAYQTTA